MKTKKFNKRLGLNKKTIADLNSKEMKDVFGRMANISVLYTNCDTAKLVCHCAYPLDSELMC